VIAATIKLRHYLMAETRPAATVATLEVAQQFEGGCPTTPKEKPRPGEGKAGALKGRNWKGGSGDFRPKHIQ